MRVHVCRQTALKPKQLRACVTEAEKNNECSSRNIKEESHLYSNYPRPPSLFTHATARVCLTTKCACVLAWKFDKQTKHGEIPFVVTATVVTEDHKQCCKFSFELI